MTNTVKLSYSWTVFDGQQWLKQLKQKVSGKKYNELLLRIWTFPFHSIRMRVCQSHFGTVIHFLPMLCIFRMLNYKFRITISFKVQIYEFIIRFIVENLCKSSNDTHFVLNG